MVISGALVLDSAWVSELSLLVLYLFRYKGECYPERCDRIMDCLDRPMVELLASLSGMLTKSVSVCAEYTQLNSEVRYPRKWQG